MLTGEDEQAGHGFDEPGELAHVYAMSIHRSQGSEYPAVVIPLTMGIADDAAALGSCHATYGQPSPAAVS